MPSRVTPVSLAFEVFDQLSNLSQFLDRRLPRCDCLHGQLKRRAAERTTRQITHQLPLRLLFAPTRSVDVRSLRLVARDQPLYRHDLQELEHRRVARRL